MKLRFRSKPYLKRFLLSTTFPAAGLSLMALTGTAMAQEEYNRSEAGIDPPAQSLLVPEPQEASAQNTGAVNPQGGLVIGDIIVIGNKTLSSSAIIALSGHKVGDPCNAQTILEMRQRLAQTGNFGMHHPDQPERWVEITNEEKPSGSGKCTLTITVDENDKVNKVQITGSGPIKPEEIEKKIKLGAVYNETDILRDTQDIQDLYNKQGYSISFGQELGMDPNNPGVLVVPIIVTRVDEIRLVKNKKTKPFVIYREMKTKKGDYFNRITFDKDRARLYNLDLFEEVLPQEEIVGQGKIRLTLNVPEKRTGSISVGVGYSNRQQLIGRAEVSETNFGGRGEAVNLLWETGGAANRNSIELGFTKPWLDKHQTALQVSLYDKIVYRFSNSLQNGSFGSAGVSSSDNRYNEQRTGAMITLSRPIRENVRLAFTLRGENVRTDSLALSGINTEIIQNGPIYSGALSVLRDTRDLVLDPVSGAYQTASIQLGHANIKPLQGPSGLPIVQAVTGSASFGKGSLEWRQYFSLQGKRKKLDQEKSAIAMRLQIGLSTGTLPFFEQYFVGGAETLRGYREDRFWGKYNLLGSIELRQPLARRLKGVLFLDAGDAWGGRYDNVNIEGFKQGGFKPHFGVGLGIRVGTPLGPIRLDYGFGDEGGRTHFSIGNVF